MLLTLLWTQEDLYCESNGALKVPFITAFTWRWRVGVRVTGWRSRWVHPVSRGRRIGIGPISHVGASTKPRSHWLTSGCWEKQEEQETVDGEATEWKSVKTSELVHKHWFAIVPWAATCSMYWPNSIAPPAAKTNLKVALPSQPPVREIIQGKKIHCY